MAKLPKIDFSKIEKKYFVIAPIILIIFVLFIVTGKNESKQNQIPNPSVINNNPYLASGENVLIIDRAEDEKLQSSEVERIVVGLWMGEDDLIYDATRYYMTKNQEVLVEFREIPYLDYLDNIEEIHRLREQLDVFLVKNVSQYAEAVSRGLQYDVDPSIRKLSLDFKQYGSAFDEIRIEEKIYGLPYKRNIYVLFFNRDLLNKLRFTIPKNGISWDLYRSLAANITRNTDYRTYGAFIDNSPQSFYIQAIQRGGSLMDNDLVRFEDAIRYRVQMELEGGIVRYGLQERLNMHFNTEFQKGTLGMHVSGDWHLLQLLDSQVEFQWGIRKAPHPQNADPNLTIGNYSLGMVSAESKNPELAFSFLSFLSGEEGAPFIAQNQVLPGFIDQRVSQRFLDNLPLRVDGAEILLEQDFLLEYPATPIGKKLATEVFYEESRNVFLQESTLEEFNQNVRRRRSLLNP